MIRCCTIVAAAAVFSAVLPCSAATRAARPAQPAPAPVHLQAFDSCAGSPLTVGAATAAGGSVSDIHAIVNAHGKPVGWIYSIAGEKSYIQGNDAMSVDDQRALALTVKSGTSELRPRPKSLPIDLAVRACLASEVSRF
jgi:hypothetical protein